MFEIVKVICVAVTALVVINSVNKECSYALAFALFAIWLRFALSAFPTITHEPIVIGMSINALASVFVVVLGLLYLPMQALLLKKLWPLYLFLAAIMISGFINALPVDLLNVTIKWLYLIVLSLAIFMSIRTHELNHTLLVLMKAFYLPVALVILSIVLGETKATERDGSLSYIGGYSHESGVSMMLIGFAFIVSLLDKTYLRLRTVIFYVALVLLILVNYRTGMLAMLPIILFFIIAGTQQKIGPKFRIVSFVGLAIFLSIVLYITSYSMSARFNDIALVLSNYEELIKAPDYFSQTERRLFSSRVYLWSQYLNEFVNASVVQQIFGHGPESWEGVFSTYAHNTFISYIYEYGIVGIVAFLGFVCSIFWYCLAIKPKAIRIKVIGALLGYMVMNLATMPLWNVEGLILFSLMVAITLSAKPLLHKKTRAMTPSTYSQGQV